MGNVSRGQSIQDLEDTLRRLKTAGSQRRLLGRGPTDYRVEEITTRLSSLLLEKKKQNLVA